MKKMLALVTLITLTITLGACGKSINNEQKLALTQLKESIMKDKSPNDPTTKENLKINLYEDKNKNKFMAEVNMPSYNGLTDKDKSVDDLTRNDYYYFKEDNKDFEIGHKSNFLKLKEKESGYNFKLIYKSEK